MTADLLTQMVFKLIGGLGIFLFGMKSMSDGMKAVGGRKLRKINRNLLNSLLRYPWPGNVRELENAIERSVVLSQSEEFTEDLLPLQIRLFTQQVRGDNSDESIEALCAKLASYAVQQYQSNEGEVYDLVIGELERHLIRVALEHHDGVKTRTADFLGINRNTLNKKVKELGI